MCVSLLIFESGELLCIRPPSDLDCSCYCLTALSTEPYTHISTDFTVGKGTSHLDKCWLHKIHLSACGVLNAQPCKPLTVLPFNQSVTAALCLTHKQDNGVTPLMMACRKNNAKCAKLLMDHGADVNAADVDGWTPLLQACNSGFAECVEVLLNGGADTQKAKQVSNLQTSCL